MWHLLVGTGDPFVGASLGMAVASGADALGGYTAAAPEGSAEVGLRFDGHEVWVGLDASALRVPEVRAGGTDAQVWFAPGSAEVGIGSDLVIAQGGVYAGGSPRAVVAGAYLRFVPVQLDGALMGLELRAFNAVRPRESIETSGFSVALRWETGPWAGDLHDGTPTPEATPDDVPTRDERAPASAPPAHQDAPDDDADGAPPPGTHHDAPDPPPAP